jgi:hypothetical protein
VTITYVFPNVLRSRGKFSQRCEFAHAVGCSYVEIPAHFVRGKIEIGKTGQEIYSIPTKKSIRYLYGEEPIPANPLPYILHTEAIIKRKSEGSRGKKPCLHWSNTQWRENFVAMLCNIAEVLGSPAAKIEIHPGERNEISLKNILDSVEFIISQYTRITGSEPEILLENRTSQRVRDGTDIKGLWNLCEENYPQLQNKFGIVLDVSQLLTVTKDNFLQSFAEIPDSCLKGFHIHYQHHPPSSSDPIPWNVVFARIGKLQQDIIINPEIHHKKPVNNAINFCKEMLAK